MPKHRAIKPTMSKKYVVFTALSIILMCPLANGWSGQIHEQIAIQASLDLSEYQYAQLDRLGSILSIASPKLYKKWLKQSGHKLPAKYQRVAWLGVWPDWIKNTSLIALLKKQSIYKVAPHFLKQKKTGRWHYDNVFFFKSAPAHTCAKRNQGELFNILEHSYNALLKKSYPDILHAIFMSFYIHLYSDAHQPLHTISRVNKSCWHDKGGNDVCLLKNKKKRCTLNLHQYWDRAGYIPLADLIRPNKNVPSPLLTDIKSDRFQQVIISESTDIYDDIYPSKISSGDRLEDALTNTYRQNVHITASEKATLAAMRLTHDLQLLLK